MRNGVKRAEKERHEPKGEWRSTPCRKIVTGRAAGLKGQAAEERGFYRRGIVWRFSSLSLGSNGDFQNSLAAHLANRKTQALGTIAVSTDRLASQAVG